MRPAALPSRRFRAISIRSWAFAAGLAFAGTYPLGASAATPAPQAHATHHPVRIDVTKIQPKSLLPKKVEHTEYLVEVNKLGQVARVASRRDSDSATFNAQTYGNALQTFIRTPDGHVVLGTYRLTYDFDPKTSRVRRDVSLVKQGGVDPNAKGAAAELLERARPRSSANPDIAPDASSIDPRSLPELKGVIEPTPLPAPTSH